MSAGLDIRKETFIPCPRCWEIGIICRDCAPVVGKIVWSCVQCGKLCKIGAVICSKECFDESIPEATRGSRASKM